MCEVSALVEPSRGRSEQGLETLGIDVVGAHRGADHRIG